MTGYLKSEWDEMATKRYFPKCFESEKQFQGWVSYARQAKPARAHSWCEDCTPEYQAKMITEKRCMYPGTLFHKSGSDLKGTDSEGDWVGRRSALEVAKIRRNAVYKGKVELV
jgi:hypothetical protein